MEASDLGTPSKGVNCYFVAYCTLIPQVAALMLPHVM